MIHGSPRGAPTKNLEFLKSLPLSVSGLFHDTSSQLPLMTHFVVLYTCPWTIIALKQLKVFLKSSVSFSSFDCRLKRNYSFSDDLLDRSLEQKVRVI